MTDGIGRNFSFTSAASRVVTIAPGATEIVFAAGGFDRLIGVSNVDSYPEEIHDLHRFSVLPIDIEAIVALKPDLVLASSQVNDPKNAISFAAVGIPIFYLDESSWEAVHASIYTAGILLGTERSAEASQTRLSLQIDSLKKKTATIEERPTVVFLISDVTSYSFGAGSYVLDLLEWAGLRPLTSELTTPAPVLSDEFVLISDPDVIIGSFRSGFQARDLLKHHPTWSVLSAVRNSRVFSVDGDTILRPGPRNVDAAYAMARAVHPHLFAIDDSSE